MAPTNVNPSNHLSPYGNVTKWNFSLNPLVPFGKVSQATFGKVFNVSPYDKEGIQRAMEEKINARRDEWDTRRAMQIARKNGSEPDLSFLNDLPTTPSTDGSSSVQSAIAAMLGSIEDSYLRQIDGLGRNKAAAASGINSAYDTFKANSGRNYADYQNASTQSQQAMAQRVADQLAAVQARQGELANAAALMGQNASAIQAQGAGNVDTLKATQAIQDALGARLAQIVANNQRATDNTADLVKAGAVGTLENNYNSMLNALQAQREQSIAEALTAASGGGRGGGGSSSGGGLKDQKLALEIAKLQKDLAGPQSWNDVLRGMDSGDLFAMIGGMSPEQQASTISSLFPQPKQKITWQQTIPTRSRDGRAAAIGISG